MSKIFRTIGGLFSGKDPPKKNGKGSKFTEVALCDFEHKKRISFNTLTKSEEELKIPDERPYGIEYKVQIDDTIYGIAIKFNISANSIKIDNNLWSDNLFPGQVYYTNEGRMKQRITIVMMNSSPEPRAKQMTKNEPEYMLEEKKGGVDRYEFYYCTTDGYIQGLLTFCPPLILFDPSDKKEVLKGKRMIRYQACIDLNDILLAEAITIPNNYDPENTRPEVFLKINVSKIKPHQVEDNLVNVMRTLRKQKKQIATVYFKLYSRSSAGREIPERRQLKVCREIASQINQLLNSNGELDFEYSSTNLPFCDISVPNVMSALKASEKKDIEMVVHQLLDHNLIEELDEKDRAGTEAEHAKRDAQIKLAVSLSENGTADEDLQKELFDKIEEDEILRLSPTSCLVGIRRERRELEMKIKAGDVALEAEPIIPNLNGRSKVMTKEMIVQLVDSLPLIYRVCDWDLIYTPGRDGMSINTLRRACANFQSTIIIIRDDSDYVFGGFADRTWNFSTEFFGSSDSYLFTFFDEGELQSFYSTNQNFFYQYMGNDGFGMGVGERNYGLFINNELTKGSSDMSITFGNPVLSKNSDFEIINLEIWGLQNNWR
eukprot:TRINITY_DN4855_c0_g2_i1.p1 TRINITY_DN4855_c0_g2~~TRINITY_DN4855_c0_g2_i1.p1  ORF type:complete len:602 (+),score=71.32 TRINITY_DN4855_c0_g2_i1:99-1904(+)